MFPGLSITDIPIPHPASLPIASVCQCDIGRISHRCTNTVAMYQFIGTSKQHLCAEEYICRFNTTRKNIFTLVSSISVHGANMGPTWVLFAPVGPMLAPWTLLSGNLIYVVEKSAAIKLSVWSNAFFSAYSVFTASDHLISHQIDGVDTRK